MPRFLNRLREYGFSSYAECLASDHWKAFKERYRAAGKPMCCHVCGGGDVELHHHTYAHLCAELLDDVTPLCREHHEAVHIRLKASGWRVERTARVLRLLGAGKAQPAAVPKKSKEQRRAERKKRRRPRRPTAERVPPSQPPRQAGEPRPWELGRQKWRAIRAQKGKVAAKPDEPPPPFPDNPAELLARQLASGVHRRPFVGR